MSNRSARFLQSAGDFPVMVTLGRESPVWELRRWGRDRLRFCPVGNDGYSLRGDRWRLLYRGERESHRFTILDDGHFEYDVILKGEPESNRIFLVIEGWEGFDFFRQPDNFGPPLLRGSYAVYKKEFVVNSEKYHVGTGKFCHIHRPKIIDGRGRETWGDVWIDRGIMTITIPEGWLGEESYPVTVDPIIGSNTIGAYSTYKYIPAYEYEDFLEWQAEEGGTADGWAYDRKLYLEEALALNRMTIPLTLQGTYNAYLYADETSTYKSGGQTVYRECAAFPLLYNSLNNKPKQMAFSNTAGAAVVVSPDSPAKWNRGTITIGTPINANTDIWFGFVGDGGIGCRFDYGTQYRGLYGYVIPSDWQDYNYQSIIEFIEDNGFADISGETDWYTDSDSDERNIYPGSRIDFKVSMYLEIPSYNYTRTLIQGVTLTDSGKRVHGIVKKLTQTVKITQVTGRGHTAIRKAVEAVGIGEGNRRSHNATRKPVETVAIGEAKRRTHNAIRKNLETITIGEVNRRTHNAIRKTVGTVAIGEAGRRIHNAIRKNPETVSAGEAKRRTHNAVREVNQTAGISDRAKREKGVYRLIANLLGVTETNKTVRTLARFIYTGVNAFFNLGHRRGLNRSIVDSVNQTDRVDRSRGMFAFLRSSLGIIDGETNRRIHNAVREVHQTAGINDIMKREKGIYRLIANLLGVTENNKAVRTLARFIYTGVNAFFNLGHRRGLNRGIADSVNQTDKVDRSRGMFAFLLSGLGANDHTGYSSIWRRNVPDIAHMVTDNQHTGNYKRGLLDTLDGTAETNNRADYIRVERDTGDVSGEARRMLHVVIRLLTGGAVRDYIIRRFLKSNEDVVLKSPVCREITIESRIH